MSSIIKHTCLSWILKIQNVLSVGLYALTLTPSHFVIYETIFVCTCCSGSRRHIFLGLRLKCVHLLRSVVCTVGGPAKFMPLTHLRLHFLILSALHFNEGASEASVCQVPALIGCVISLKHFTRVVFEAGLKSQIARCSKSSHGRKTLFVGWMELNLRAKQSCDHTPQTLMAKYLAMHCLPRSG